MSKISINTDKINNDLLPLVKTKNTQINQAKDSASRVSYPNDDYNFGNICNQIDDCLEKTSKYYNWISGLNNKYISIISSSIDNMNAIEVESIRKQDV